jgi:hypothetical protein
LRLEQVPIAPGAQQATPGRAAAHYLVVQQQPLLLLHHCPCHALVVSGIPSGRSAWLLLLLLHPVISI